MLIDKHNCNDCIHHEVCLKWLLDLGVKTELLSPCDKFESRNSDDATSAPTCVWIKHAPEWEEMEKFHAMGIGKGMSKNSIFWTCSNCGIWGTPIYKYCHHCGAKMNNAEKDDF